jgi:alpha-mannosidase
VTISESAEGFVLENEHVRATLGRDGSLASLYDKRARKESIEPGKAGNRFVLFDDEPNNFDAWDVEVFHLEKRYEAGAARSARVTEHGPLRASVAFEYELSPDSRLEQTISLTATSPRLDFSTQVEWHERHKFLKAEFPLNIRAQNATYEIQFGHLQRPTHFNTTWDLARFEVCAQKWADLSEHGFGVALLNDCKYGYATHGNVMRLSLLRSPKSPDPEADMGQHAFRYALLPHPGTFQEVGVIEEGYRFNEELMVRATNLPAGETSFFQVEPRGVILETVKKAEDTDDLVLRLYEAYGSHNSARLTTTLPVASAMICNLLEDDGQAIEWTRDGLTLELRPFQIVTIKLKLR